MIALNALALVAFLLLPGWLAVSLLEGKDGMRGTRGGEGPCAEEGEPSSASLLDGKEKLFLAAALGTGIVSLCALALALASAYRLWSLLLLVALLCVPMAVLGRQRLSWPLRLGRKDYLICLALVAVALVISTPPGRTVFGWSDVGVYADISANIDRTGSIYMVSSTVREVSPERRHLVYEPNQNPDLPFEAYENKAFLITNFDSGRVIPIFYHLWPSFMAVFASFLGLERMFWAVTAMAVLGFWGLFALARRLLGWRWAMAALALMGLSPLFVYFSRYCTSEMMNMAFFLAGSFCLTSYLGASKAKEQKEAVAVAAAGAFLFTCGFLCRIDFLMALVPLLLFFAGKRAFRSLTKADRWFCGLVVAGAASSIVIGATLSPVYFKSVIGPLYPPWRFFTSLYGLVLLSSVLAFLFSGYLAGAARRLAKMRGVLLPMLWAVLIGGFIYLYFIRSGYADNLVDYGVINRIQGPTYSSQTLIRWAWYYSFPGLLLALVGYGLWLSRRDRNPGLPAAIIGLTVTIVYGHDMRCTPLQILAMRRLIPVIFPISMIMMGYCLQRAYGWLQGGEDARRARALASALVVGGVLFYLVVFSVNVSSPNFGLEEGGNQVEVTRQVAESMEEDGVLLMDFYLGDLFGPPLRCLYGVENAWLMDNSHLGDAAFSALLADLAFPGRRVYLLWRPEMSGESLPDLGNGQDLTVKTKEIFYSSEETLVKSFYGRPDRRVYNNEPVWLFEVSSGAGNHWR